MATPYATLHFEEVASTQDEARRAFDGVPVLVTAARQSAGRGRQGAEWWNAPRPLAASLAFRPAWPVATWPRLALVAGLAACAALGKGVIKWPNDLRYRGRKIGGVIAESDTRSVVVGLGVNLWWPGAPPTVGGLYDVDPGPSESQRVATRWAGELLRRAAASPDEWGRAEYLELCETIGTRIEWDPGGSGMAVDVDLSGALVVDTGASRVLLSSGEVRQIRPATLGPAKEVPS